MKRYNTIIVEDEGPARRRLEAMVERHPDLKLQASLRSGKEAIEKIPELQPELLLLDIQLKDKTAFEVLQQIRSAIDSKIIFITAYDQYALKAFEVEAVDYLLKPYDDERFAKSIERIVKKDDHLNGQELLQKLSKYWPAASGKIIIPEGNKNHLFHPEEILLIQSEKYYSYIIREAEKKLIRITLKKLEKLLPETFIRVNKSCIVNNFHIIEYQYNKLSGYVVLSNGTRVEVGKSYLPKLR